MASLILTVAWAVAEVGSSVWLLLSRWHSPVFWSRVEQVGEIDLATLEHGEPGRSLRNAPVDKPLHRRHLSPIALVGLHDELDARRAGHELVGSSADGVLLEAVFAHRLCVFSRHDPAGGRGKRAIEGHEVRPGLLEDEAHPVGIDDLDLLD